MQQRKIGSLTVSAIGLGCNNFGMRIDGDAANAVIDAAIDAGVTFFDTSDSYGATRSEEIIGAGIRGRRDQVVIATKFASPIGDNDPEHSGASPRWIAQAVEGSLRRLGTDYIDLYQQHRPDPDVPLDETLGALNELVQAGKVREIGCSNFGVDLLESAEQAASKGGFARYVSVQNELSLARRKPLEDVLPACDRMGLAFLPYFPLASGLLTGKYQRGEAPPAGTRLSMLPADRADAVLSDKNFALVERLSAYAADHGHTLLELAIAWLAAQPAVASVIAGATKPEQVRANAAAAAWELSDAQRDEVTALAAG
jgi:aryl-alcohol dehydrogenase-like predicted oxidoreductase